MGVRELRSSISFSVALHAFLLMVGMIVLSHQVAQKNTKTIWIEVDPFSKVPTQPKDKDQDLRDKRIVQSEVGRKIDKPLANAHLGQRTQAVDIQSVSKERSIALGQEQVTAKKKPAQNKVEEGKKLTLNRLGLPILPKLGQEPKPFEQNPDRTEWAPRDMSAPKDYIKGLKESDRTALNTREYVFYGYFQRIRQRLDLAWTRSLREELIRLYKSGRRLASDMEHTTRLVVTLDNIGQIIRVQVLEESGTRDLDDAAVKAFNQAGPFPNPPRGIVDANGLIQIRWDFVLRS